jgi:hypothetical protein
MRAAGVGACATALVAVNAAAQCGASGERDRGTM